MNRLWHYSYSSWKPPWWNYVIPFRGGDELGRLTLVIPVHPFGFLVWAYWTCHCEDCQSTRAFWSEDAYSEDRQEPAQAVLEHARQGDA